VVDVCAGAKQSKSSVRGLRLPLSSSIPQWGSELPLSSVDHCRHGSDLEFLMSEISKSFGSYEGAPGPIFVYSPQPPKRRRECVKRATRITN